MYVVYIKETLSGRLVDSGFDEYDTLEEAMAEAWAFRLTCGDYGKIEVMDNGDVIHERTIQAE